MNTSVKTGALGLQVAHFLRRMGIPGWFGLALLVLMAGYSLAFIQPGLARWNQVQAEVGDLQEKLSVCSSGAAAQTPAQRLASFYGEFPTGERVPDELARLFKFAETHNLALDIGEYGLVRAQGGRLDQFRITLPVKGSYPDIRAFAAEALEAVPALSLESVALRREKVADNTVEGRVVFLLFVEHEA
jgi:hypothetical protein